MMMESAATFSKSSVPLKKRRGKEKMRKALAPKAPPSLQVAVADVS